MVVRERELWSVEWVAQTRTEQSFQKTPSSHVVRMKGGNAFRLRQSMLYGTLIQETVLLFFFHGFFELVTMLRDPVVVF